MAQLTNPQDLLKNRVHLGHLTHKWDPRFAPYIFMERNGIHIIDLNLTLKQLQKATQALKEIVQSGKKVLFVATKKQAKTLVKDVAERLGQPYVVEKWSGGTLTNFGTMRKRLKKRSSMELYMTSSAYQHLTKKEQLNITREKAKLDKALEGLSSINRLPAAVFVVDIKKEQTCVREANRLGMPVFAMVDTDSSPDLVDHAIPANDDASSSIGVILNYIADHLAEAIKAVQESKAAEAGS